VATQEACYACDEYLHGIVTIISITIIIPITAAQASCEEGLFQRIVGIMVYLIEEHIPEGNCGADGAYCEEQC